MVEVRLVAEYPCEKCGKTHVDERIVDAGCFGSGGSRRILQVDYEAAERAASELIFIEEWYNAGPGGRLRSDVVRVVVDVALGLSEEPANV